MNWQNFNRRKFLASAVKAGVLGGAGFSFPRSLFSASNGLPKLLHIYCSGGWDSTMVFEDKTEVETVASQSGVSAAEGAGDVIYLDHSSRTSTKSFFDTHGEKVAIVNGIGGNAIGRLQAYAEKHGVNSKDFDMNSDIGSTFAYYVNQVANIPHINFNAPLMPGDIVGTQAHIKTENLTDYTGSVSEVTDFSDAVDSSINSFVSGQYQSLLGTLGTSSIDYSKVNNMYLAQVADPLIKSSLAAGVAAAGSQGSAEADWVYQSKIAMEMFAVGSCQAATIQMGADNRWSTRGSSHYTQQSVLFEELFENLSTLISYADTKSLSSQLTILVTSERGRSPVLNSDGGKDPWPVTSALLWGADINSGVYGATDQYLRSSKIDMATGLAKEDGTHLTMANVIGGLYTALDLAMSRFWRSKTTPVLSAIDGS